VSSDNQEGTAAAQPLDPAMRATAMQASRYMTWSGVGELILSVVVMLLMKSSHNHLWYVYGLLLVIGGCTILGYGQFMRRRVARMS
jgi:multidrug transporter EmrE-like cation transporter